MYGFQPLADNTGTHFGFIVWGIIVAIIVIIFWKDEERMPYSLVVVLMIITGLLYLGSFHDVAPKNEKVIATLVTFEPRDVTYTEMVGKTSTTKHRTDLYVTYKVKEGLVSLKANPGSVYPESVFLYKN